MRHRTLKLRHTGLLVIGLGTLGLVAACGEAPADRQRTEAPAAETGDMTAPEQAPPDAAETEANAEMANAPRLEEAWTLDGFAEPEGVTLSADGTFYYVSNVDGGPGETDGAGFISRISLNGEMLERDWASGLDAPKGMAVLDGSLFVSDITTLKRIDTATGEIAEVIEMPGGGLNDVTADEELGVLVSNSAGSEIYRYRDGEVSTFLADERLTGINGILLHDGAVLAVTMPAGELVSIDPETKEITPLADGMENADMMAPLEGLGQAGGYIVSSWPGILWHVAPDGETRILQDTREGPVMMNDFTLNGDMLITPNMMPGTVTAYRVEIR